MPRTSPALLPSRSLTYQAISLPVPVLDHIASDVTSLLVPMTFLFPQFAYSCQSFAQLPLISFSRQANGRPVACNACSLRGAPYLDVGHV